MTTNAPADYATRRWNPTTGCSPVSAGCANCWAKRFATRHRGRFGYPVDDPFRPTCHHDRLDEPLHWRKPQVVAVSFMGDLFHDEIPFPFIVKVIAAMHANPRHRFLVLTKRPRRLCETMEYLDENGIGRLGAHIARAVGGSAPWPPRNLWLGVSVEDQRTADERIPILLDTPAAHRWVSLEPQIKAVDLRMFLDPARTARLDLVIQGCESGPGRRPFDLAWARSVRDQCAAAKVPYYLKQIPGRVEIVVRRRGTMYGHTRVQGVVGKHPFLDGRQHLDLPWVKP